MVKSTGAAPAWVQRAKCGNRMRNYPPGPPYEQTRNVTTVGISRGKKDPLTVRRCSRIRGRSMVKGRQQVAHRYKIYRSLLL